MQKNSFLLYGANGYTGKLITGLAASYGLQPVLAGRNEPFIRLIAEAYKLSYAITDLKNKATLEGVLKEHKVVLHAAGPFRHTAQPMIEACLNTHTHYIDITGEVEAFEKAKQYDDKAKEAGIMLLPGAGFDVVPTDCLALYLKENLPDAEQLQLAFTAIGGGISHGTAMSMAEQLGKGGAVRENGAITQKPLAHKGMWVDFGEKKDFVATIPWGDIATAYYTTGIPDIECYTTVPPSIYKILKGQWAFNWLLRTSAARNFIKKKISKRPEGPTPEQRHRSKTLVWGKVQNKKGDKVQARISCADGYTFTAHSSLLIIEKVLNGNLKMGYQTPAGAYGADLVLEVPGSSRELVV